MLQDILISFIFPKSEYLIPTIALPIQTINFVTASVILHSAPTYLQRAAYTRVFNPIIGIILIVPIHHIHFKKTASE
jgi:energy-converting hydrogenase Eha subunit C